MSFIKNQIALTESQLQSAAPSIFASEPHHSRSQRYGYFNSIALIRALVEKGFGVYDARQAKARIEDKKEFTKHIVRLRHVESFERTQALFIEGREQNRDTHTAEARALARAIPGYGEVVLTNSHDGSSAVVLHGGLHRPDCFNGLFVSDGLVSSIHVTHSKRLVANVIDGAFTVVDELPKAVAVAAAWGHVQLTDQRQLEFARRAAVLRFADKEVLPVEPQALLIPRRTADKGTDLWRVFNRVQENVIKGGLTTQRNASPKEIERGRKPVVFGSTREIKGIDQDVSLNKGLWALGEEFAQAA